MLKLFKSKSRSVIGIDISSSSVKALQLSVCDETWRVENYASELLSPDILEGNTVKDIEALGLCLKRLLARANMTTRAAVVAVPDSAVITKTIQVDEGLSEDEIEEVIVMEADKYIPYPIDEINIDFEVIGHSAKNASMVDVLIVASRAANVSSRVEALSAAGLEAMAVDVESFAVERAAQFLTHDLPAQGQDKIVAVIDIGTFYTHLFVLHGMKIIFTREEEFGGRQLISSLAEHCAVSPSDATTMLQEQKLPEDYQQAVLEPFIEKIQLQIKRTLQFFFSTSQYDFVDHIILAGGVAGIPDLPAKIKESTSIPTTLANPFAHMEVSRHLTAEQMAKIGPSSLIACGLALRSIS